MSQLPLSATQWNYIKGIKDDIRNYSLNTSYVVLRTKTRGGLVSGFNADIWDTNYASDSIVDEVISGEFFDTAGKNYQYVEGGRFQGTDAQFLTLFNYKNSFQNCNEVWKNVTFSGGLIPVYVSGTNNFVSGDAYQVLGIRELPYSYELNLYLKLKI